MTIFQALFLGVIEGMTEFLPISSTFHLLIASQLLGIAQTEFSKFFDVFIQAGAILAVFVLFAKDWFSNRDLLQKVAVSFLPTAAVGFLLHDVIKDVFFSSFQAMVLIFILIGVLFLVVEQWLCQKDDFLKKTTAEMSYLHAGLIGLAQAVAVMPGVSRAGAVILIMLLMGYKREDAAKYSFTLAVPTILAAALLDLMKSRELLAQATGNEVTVLLVGSLAAFVSAFVVVKWFIHFVRTRTFRFFGWYRIVGGALLFWLVR
ncbi:undecaprenyl-diphosphate phosphatase [Patescibacteria group bacterium]|nr:undecaprenyl-diphosphate phosphatase [Patescibacteria group bacterium]